MARTVFMHSDSTRTSVVAALGAWLSTGVLLSSCLTLLSCASGHRKSTADVASLEQLESWMTGTFSSAAQATADPDFFAIRLVVLPIWEDRSDGPWLYVEQAAHDTVERPYRQRVYHLSAGPDGSFASAVFELPGDPQRYAGCWNAPALLDEFGPDDLLPRDGCTLTLTATDGTYRGSTAGTGCSSRLAGASYATSIVTVTPDALESWDRGFAAEGGQVWGAESGPYMFARTDSGAPPKN